MLGLPLGLCLGLPLGVTAAVTAITAGITAGFTAVTAGFTAVTAGFTAGLTAGLTAGPLTQTAQSLNTIFHDAGFRSRGLSAVRAVIEAVGDSRRGWVLRVESRLLCNMISYSVCYVCITLIMCNV